VQEYGLQVCNRSNEKIMNICGKFKESLTIRRNKLDKLCDTTQSATQEEHLTKTPSRVGEIFNRLLAPPCS